MGAGHGTILDEDTDAYVSLTTIIRDFLTAVPAAVEEYEKLRVNGCKVPDLENSPIWRDLFNEPQEPTGSHLPMLSEAGIQNLFNHVHELWVEPELVKRREAGSLPDDFQIRMCLIKLPKAAPPIVQFNSEVRWEVKIKTPAGIEFVKDEPVHIHQVESVVGVLPPTHENVRVAFVFLCWTGTHWRIVFDFSPNDEGYVPKEISDDWEYGPAITEYLNLVLRERVIHAHDIVQTDIARIALWPAPALLPYPLSKICDLCKNGELKEARSLLTSHCNGEFITNLVAGWDGVTAFVDRSQLFSETLQAHLSQQYMLIYVDATN